MWAIHVAVAGLPRQSLAILPSFIGKAQLHAETRRRKFGFLVLELATLLGRAGFWSSRRASDHVACAPFGEEVFPVANFCIVAGHVIRYAERDADPNRQSADFRSMLMPGLHARVVQGLRTSPSIMFPACFNVKQKPSCRVIRSFVDTGSPVWSRLRRYKVRTPLPRTPGHSILVL